MQQPPECPVCKEAMTFVHGCGWDYDRWFCTNMVGRFELCSEEIELDESTYPEGVGDVSGLGPKERRK